MQKGLWQGALQEARKAMSGAWPVSSPFFKAHIMFCSRPTGTTDCHVIPPRLFLMPRSFAVASLLSAKFPSFTIAEELALGAQVKKEKKKEWFVLKYIVKVNLIPIKKKNQNTKR